MINTEWFSDPHRHLSPSQREKQIIKMLNYNADCSYKSYNKGNYDRLMPFNTSITILFLSGHTISE